MFNKCLRVVKPLINNIMLINIYLLGGKNKGLTFFILYCCSSNRDINKDSVEYFSLFASIEDEYLYDDCNI